MKDLESWRFEQKLFVRSVESNTPFIQQLLQIGLTTEYPSTNLHKNNVYCILTCSSKNAAKFKQQWGHCGIISSKYLYGGDRNRFLT